MLKVLKQTTIKEIKIVYLGYFFLLFFIRKLKNRDILVLQLQSFSQRKISKKNWKQFQDLTQATRRKKIPFLLIFASISKNFLLIFSKIIFLGYWIIIIKDLICYTIIISLVITNCPI